jgi:hypothetical protein
MNKMFVKIVWMFARAAMVERLILAQVVMWKNYFSKGFV